MKHKEANLPTCFNKENFVIFQREEEGKTHQTSIQIGGVSHLTLHAAGPPGEQLGFGDRQTAPAPTLLANLCCIR